MSISPPPVREILVRRGPEYLARFHRHMAPVVASWARDADELFLLAPKTFPPLTADKVIAWTGLDGSPLVFCRDDLSEPIGYLELNPMPGERRHLWLGHCIIRPEERGAGAGRRMVELMLYEAFVNRRADRVSLVVFPDNHAAVRCYRSAGFASDGVQVRHFQTTARQHRMLQMTLYQDTWKVRCKKPLDA